MRREDKKHEKKHDRIKKRKIIKGFEGLLAKVCNSNISCKTLI